MPAGSTGARPVVVAACLGLALAGCGSSGSTAGGPAALTDGSYRILAASDGATPAATLDLTGVELTLTDAGATTRATIGGAAPEVVLCPPSGKGEPRRLDSSVTVGELRFEQPAIFGDCGQTKPLRVTLVDLKSSDGSQAPLPFARWVEFCASTDPDCPASP